MLGSLREALRSGIPTAALFHSLGAFWSTGMQNPVVNAFLRPVGLAPLSLLRGADALLLPTDPELDPVHPSGSKIAFDWLGTTEPGVPRPSQQPDRQRVLVSLSSAWQRGQGAVYERILQALAPLPVDVIVTTGGVELERDLVAPPNAEVHARIPHEEVMPSVGLVIGHGGHSTTLKALAHGIPLLLLPLDPTSDQPLIGRTIEAAGLGRSLPRASSAEAIRSAAIGILADAAIAASADRVGQRLRGQHGAEAGADRVEGIIRQS